MRTIEHYRQLAHANGCRAKTARGLVRWMANGGAAKAFVVEPTYYSAATYPRSMFRHKWRQLAHEARTPRTPVRHAILSAEADRIAREDNPRIRNWEHPWPRTRPVEIGTVDKVDQGQYSRGCTYTKYAYHPLYTSYAVVAQSGETITYVRHGVADRVIRAPKGLRWSIDAGLVIVAKDGTEYHPTWVDLQTRAIARLLRARLAEARIRRREVVAQAALDLIEAERIEKLAEEKRAEAREAENQKLALTAVTYHDARMAGNCSEGIDRYLRAIRLSDLPAWGAIRADKLPNRESWEVRRAIVAADRRLTLVTI